MALAVRRGKLKRSEVSTSVLDVVDSDMSNKEIEDFTVLKENNIHSMQPLYEYIMEAGFSHWRRFQRGAGNGPIQHHPDQQFRKEHQ